MTLSALIQKQTPVARATATAATPATERAGCRPRVATVANVAGVMPCYKQDESASSGNGQEGAQGWRAAERTLELLISRVTVEDPLGKTVTPDLYAHEPEGVMMVTLELLGPPLTVKLNGHVIQLHPGDYVEVMQEQGLKVLAKAPGRVRVVAEQAPLTPGAIITWESPVVGRLSGPVLAVLDESVTVQHPLSEAPCTIPKGWIRSRQTMEERD